MDAIVYTSNTGYTEHYAQLLAEATGKPVYALAEAKGQLNKGTRVVYLGWLMAGQIKGYNQAAHLYQIDAVCAVGMGPSFDPKVEQELKERYHLTDTPVFVLQGGFDINKLSGVYRFMMNAMVNTVGKKIEEKADKTPEEEEMAELLLHGGDRVDKKSLDPVLEWLERCGQ